VRYAHHPINLGVSSKLAMVGRLTPEPNPAFRLDEEIMNLDETVVLRTYTGESVANIAASRLGIEGIEAHIQKDDCGGAYPSLQMARGVRLVVRAEDVEDAERILNEMESEETQKVDLEAEQEDRRTLKSTSSPVGVLPMKDLPSQQLDELKTFIFAYVVLAPLLSALFADKINNMFVVCLLFVGLVGTAVIHLKSRLELLEKSLKEQERRIMERADINDEGSE
jgi:hypothetical protein